MRRILLLLPLLTLLVAPSAASATFPGPAGRIVFDRYVGSGSTHPILTMLPNGTAKRQVYSWTTERRVHDVEASASGRLLVFGQTTDRAVSIQRMTLAGTGRTVLRSGLTAAANASLAQEPHWLPSGQLWFQLTHGFTHTDLLAPGDRIVVRSFEHANADGTASTSWSPSPDGSRVVYERVRRRLDETGQFVLTDRDLWIVDADGTDDHQLTTFGDLLDRSDGSAGTVLWSRTGLIYFSAVRPGTDDSWLYRIAADGTGLTLIAREPKDYAISPNGRTLAFVSNGGVLVVADRFGNNRRTLARNVEAIVMSPDSRRVAYSQLLFDQTDVMSVRFDGLGRMNLTRTTRASEAPLDWARVPPRS